MRTGGGAELAPAAAGPGREAVRARAAAPLRALVELRLLLLWRRFRGRGGIPEIVARLALFAVAIPAGLAFAVLAASGAWQAVRTPARGVAELSVAALLFGVWQTWTAVSLSISERETIDLRRFLQYPIPPWRVFGYGLAASVVGDPFAAFWSLMLGGAFAGAALARPGAWLLLLAATYALFVAGTAAYVALLQGLLARLLRGRRAREVAIAAVYLGTTALVLFVSGGARPALQALRALRAVRWLAVPPALAERSVSALYRGDPGRAAAWILALALATAAIAWAAYRLALSDALAGGDGAPRTAATGAGGWRLPGARGALLEKEGKYLLRHPLASVLALVVPAFAALVGWKLAPRIPAEAGEVVRALPLLGFALYAHLAAQPFWLNAFGWERGGARTWFLAPVAPAGVLAAKNAATYAFSLALFASSAAAGFATGGLPPAWALAAAVALHAGIAPWLLAAGNVVSILNPRPAPLAIQRGGAVSPASALAGMAIFSACVALFAAPVVFAIRLDAPWLLPAGFGALGLAGAAAYRVALPRTARLLERRREALLDAVCGDEA